MTEEDFEDDLDALVSAGNFLDYFGIEYGPSVVHISRLHILQRFNEYLATANENPGFFHIVSTYDLCMAL